MDKLDYGSHLMQDLLMMALPYIVETMYGKVFVIMLQPKLEELYVRKWDTQEH